MGWQQWLAVLGPLLALIGVVWTVYGSIRMKRGDHQVAREAAAQADLAERFDDASQLAEYIRREVERQVELQVTPIRAELELVKTESHEMTVAVRARETQLWMWDQRGRPGQLPRLPNPILHRLGLGYLADDDWHTEPSPI